MEEWPHRSDNPYGYLTSTVIRGTVGDSERRGRDDPLLRKRSADEGERGGPVGMAHRPKCRENSSDRVTDEDDWSPRAKGVDESIEIGEMKLAVVTTGRLVRLPEAGQIR
jgi:hypothetical protein